MTSKTVRFAWSLAALLSAFVFLSPLAVLMLVSLQPPDTGAGANTFAVEVATWRSFARAFSDVPLLRGLWNSTWIALVAVPLSLLIASAGGLAIALSHRRRVWMLVLTVAMSIPTAALWVPRFWLFKVLGLTDTGLPLIAPALMGGAPLIVLLFAVAFSRVPRELFDAAVLERSSVLRVWWQIALPLVRPTTAGAAVITFLLFWNNLVDPLLYVSSEGRFTAPLVLRLLELLGPTNWAVLLAGAVIVTLPPALLFVWARRWLFGQERTAGWLGR